MSDYDPRKHFEIGSLLTAGLAGIGLLGAWYRDWGYVIGSLAFIGLLSLGQFWELRRFRRAQIERWLRREIDRPPD